MSTWEMARLLCLLVLSVLVAGSVRPALPSLLDRASPLFRRVDVEHATAAPGDAQTLSVTLNQPAGTTTIFQLAITYANGATQDVVGETISSAATLSWIVPPDAAAGTARFKLASTGCGCGDRSRPANPISTESTAEGHFSVLP